MSRGKGSPRKSRRSKEVGGRRMISYVPTLTDVLASSSDALLAAPPRLLMLIRLELLFGRTMALMGREGRSREDAGDPGGTTIAASD